MSEPATVDELRQIPYLASLARGILEALAAELPVHNYGTRELIIRAGAPATGFFLLRQGKARIFRGSPEGREQILRLVTPGSTFGEVPALDGQPNPASVEALEPCEAVFFPAQRLTQLVLAHPAVGLALVRHLARRLRAFTELVEQISLQTVQGRLARYLYQVAREEGVPSDEGLVIPRELTLQDLAALLGSVREVVSRTMHVLEEDGVVTVRRREIVIRDLDQLRQML